MSRSHGTGSKSLAFRRMLRRTALHTLTRSCAAWCTQGLAAQASAQQRRQRHDDAGELYEILGIRRHASKDDIKKAFREVLAAGSAVLTVMLSAGVYQWRAPLKLGFIHMPTQKAKQHHPDRHHAATRGQNLAQRATFARILAAYQVCRAPLHPGNAMS